LSQGSLPASPEKPHSKKGKGRVVKKAYIDFTDTESLPYTAPEQHHHISTSHNFYLNIPSFLEDHEGDPAIKVNINVLCGVLRS
jgi:hypothetical protein